MKASKRRLERLEQVHQPADKEEWVITSGEEYDLPPADGGWMVLLRQGQLIKAWSPASLWDAR